MSSTQIENAKNNNFSIHSLKVPLLSKALKQFTPPAISTDVTKVPYQTGRILADTGVVTFGPLTLDIRIDENHEIVHQIYNWIGLTHDNEQILGTLKEVSLIDMRDDIIITYLDSNKKPVVEYTFVGCIVSSFDIDPGVRGQSEVLIASLTLEFDYLTIENI